MKKFDVVPRINVALTRAQMALKHKQKGLTMVEYAVAGSLIVLVCVIAFTNLGQAVANAINRITGVINNGA